MAMSDRNLLYVELTYDYLDGDKYFPVEKMKELVRQQAGCLTYLRRFRTKPGPYLVWVSYGHKDFPLGYVGFTIRLDNPYDTDFVIPAFRDLPHVKAISTSWFPSREPYGGTVQPDGSIIETWDI